MKDGLSYNQAFIKAAGWAFLGQLFCTLALTVVVFTLGTAPENAAEYFKAMEQSVIAALIRDEAFSVILIFLYLLTFYGLFLVLKNRHPVKSFLAFSAALMGIVLTIASHPGFSMLRLFQLSLEYPEMRDMYITAGESLLAGNMWHNTGGFFTGIFLQGGGILFSLAMISDGRFRKITWISGLAANGLDLINHLLHYSNPELAGKILMAAGPFYLIWMLFMALDLFRIATGLKKENE